MCLNAVRFLRHIHHIRSHEIIENVGVRLSAFTVLTFSFVLRRNETCISNIECRYDVRIMSTNS